MLAERPIDLRPFFGPVEKIRVLNMTLFNQGGLTMFKNTFSFQIVPSRLSFAKITNFSKKISLVHFKSYGSHLLDPSYLGKTSKKNDYLVTLIKRVGGYLAEITTS